MRTRRSCALRCPGCCPVPSVSRTSAEWRVCRLCTPESDALAPPFRRSFYDKRLSAEVDGEDVGDEFAGYILKILGGQDKQGFAMKQGVLTQDRVKLMMSKGA